MFSGQVAPVAASNSLRSWYPCIGSRARSERRPRLIGIHTEYAYSVCTSQERQLQFRDRLRAPERGAEQLLDPAEPVTQRVRVDVHGLGRGVDVHVAGEVRGQGLEQRRVLLDRGEDLPQ